MTTPRRCPSLRQGQLHGAVSAMRPTSAPPGRDVKGALIKTAAALPHLIIASLLWLVFLAALPPTIGVGVTVLGASVLALLALGVAEGLAVRILRAARRPTPAEARRLGGPTAVGRQLGRRHWHPAAGGHQRPSRRHRWPPTSPRESRSRGRLPRRADDRPRSGDAVRARHRSPPLGSDSLRPGDLVVDRPVGPDPWRSRRNRAAPGVRTARTLRLADSRRRGRHRRRPRDPSRTLAVRPYHRRLHYPHVPDPAPSVA
jgi:hypothetical protein